MKHKDIHKFTKEARFRTEKSIIHYFVVKKTVRNKRCYCNEEEERSGSDNYLIMEFFAHTQIMREGKRKKLIVENTYSYKFNITKRLEDLEEKLRNKTNREEYIETKSREYKQNILEMVTGSCGVVKTVQRKLDGGRWKHNKRRRK